MRHLVAVLLGLAFCVTPLVARPSPQSPADSLRFKTEPVVGDAMRCGARMFATNSHATRDVLAIVQKTQPVFMGELTSRVRVLVPREGRAEIGCSLSAQGWANFEVVQAWFTDLPAVHHRLQEQWQESTSSVSEARGPARIEPRLAEWLETPEGRKFLAKVILEYVTGEDGIREWLKSDAGEENVRKQIQAMMTGD